jgi:hypothetical protein
MRNLLTVEDTFLIESRGLVVIPAPAVDEVRGPGDVQVELLKPDGSKLSATLTLMSEFLYPPPPVLRWCCVFKSLSKMDVPIGTEIWCDEKLFLVSEATADKHG